MSYMLLERIVLLAPSSDLLATEETGDEIWIFLGGSVEPPSFREEFGEEARVLGRRERPGGVGGDVVLFGPRVGESRKTGGEHFHARRKEGGRSEGGGESCRWKRVCCPCDSTTEIVSRGRC